MKKVLHTIKIEAQSFDIAFERARVQALDWMDGESNQEEDSYARVHTYANLVFVGASAPLVMGDDKTREIEFTFNIEIT
jgi:hypothetical protein